MVEKKKFLGEVETRWLVEDGEKLPWYKRWTSAVFDWDADRKMELLSDFGYRDEIKERERSPGPIYDVNKIVS